MKTVNQASRDIFGEEDKSATEASEPESEDGAESGGLGMRKHNPE
jgi:hypothetical protein